MTQLEEYLLSTDQDTVLLGLEIVNTLDWPLEDKIKYLDKRGWSSTLDERRYERGHKYLVDGSEILYHHYNPFRYSSFPNPYTEKESYTNESLVATYTGRVKDNRTKIPKKYRGKDLRHYNK